MCGTEDAQTAPIPTGPRQQRTHLGGGGEGGLGGEGGGGLQQGSEAALAVMLNGRPEQRCCCQTPVHRQRTGM